MIQRWRVVNFLALFCCFDLLQMQPLHIKHSITYICRYQIHFMSVCHLIQSSNTVSQQHTQQGCMRINIFFSGAYTDHLWVTMFYSQPKMRGCSALLFFFQHPLICSSTPSFVPAPPHLFQHPLICSSTLSFVPAPPHLFQHPFICSSTLSFVPAPFHFGKHE